MPRRFGGPRFPRLVRLGHLRRSECEASVSLRAPLVPLAFVGFLIAWLLRPGPFAFTGVVFIGSVLILTLAWAVAMAKQVTTRRALRFTALQVGDHLEEVIHLENRSLFPVVSAEFVDLSGMPGYDGHTVRVAGPRSTVRWRLSTSCTQRGVYPLGHWEVRYTDPFGIFGARQNYRHDLEITVCPPLAALPRRPISHRRAPGEGLTLRQPLPADTPNAMSTRPYAIGDPASRIHWRTSARQGELYVRLFDPEATSALWLVLDLDREVHCGTGDAGSLEQMIIAGASLAARHLGERRAVGMLLDGEQTVVVPPLAGQEYLWTLLRALATARPGGVSLAAALAHASSIVSNRDSVVLLTPSLEFDWVDRVSSLSAGARGGVEVWLLDRASFGGRGGAVNLARMLSERSIPTEILRRSEIRPVPGAYAPLRHWEFRTLATGRVIPRRAPRRASADA